MNLPNGRLHGKEVMRKIIGVELTAARWHAGTCLHPANKKRGGEETRREEDKRGNEPVT